MQAKFSHGHTDTGFSDALTLGSCACVYMVWGKGDKIEPYFQQLLAKCYVAPMVGIMVPRGELQAMVIMHRMVVTVARLGQPSSCLTQPASWTCLGTSYLTPVQAVAIDLFGPFMVKDVAKSRRTFKCWACMYVCIVITYHGHPAMPRL